MSDIERMKNDIKDIGDTTKRIEQILTGSIVDGEAKVGVLEDIRQNKKDIKDLQGDYKNVKELNKSVETLYKWKYLIVGGFLVAVFFIDKIFEALVVFVKSSLIK